MNRLASKLQTKRLIKRRFMLNFKCLFRVSAAVGLLFLLETARPAAASPSLQELVNTTPANGTLLLEGQTYSGNVTITKPLTLIGTDKTVIQGDGTGDVVMITAAGVHLESLNIRHSSMNMSSNEEYAAVRLSGATGAVLRHLHITDAYHGIYLKNANDNEISDTVILGHGQQEVYGQGSGIQLVHANRNKLLNNTITATRDGIYFYYADDNQSDGNSITQTRYGLHYMYSNGNRFTGNQFSKNLGGAAIMVSSNIILANNEFSFQQGSQAFGILLQESQQVHITGNRFYQNLRGLYIDNSHDNFIADNVFLHNKVGAEIWSSADKLTFTQNRFLRNAAPVIAMGDQRTNQWSVNGRGNVWDDEPLLDLNEDGIGDNPIQYKSSLYKLIQDNELVYLFLSSPAIGIYERINLLLNRQNMMVEDPYPLMAKSIGLPARDLAWLLLPAAGAAWWYGRRRRRKP